MIVNELEGHSGLARVFELREGDELMKLKIYPDLDTGRISASSLISDPRDRGRDTSDVLALRQGVVRFIQNEVDRLGIPISHADLTGEDTPVTVITPRR